MEQKLLQAALLTFALQLLAGLSTPSTSRTQETLPLAVAKDVSAELSASLFQPIREQNSQTVDSMIALGTRSP